MNASQLRVALGILAPDDLPLTFPIGQGRRVANRARFLDGLRVEAEAGRLGWHEDLRAALDWLKDPDGFGRRYDAAGGQRKLPETATD